MAGTVTLGVSTGAFPAMTVNSMKYVIYAETDPLAEVASQIFAPPGGIIVGQPARTVSFPGLFRTNYQWVLLEITSGGAIVRTIGTFFIVPDNNDVIYRAPEIIEVDVTIGVLSTPAPQVAFTMDGTGGTEDWRGFDIYVDHVGVGLMRLGIDFSWNKTTGQFSLLIAGQSLQPNDLYGISFGLITTAATGVPNLNPFTGVLIVSADTVLTAGDMGKKIIVKGASDLITLTLPAIAGVVESRMTYFESGIGAHKCVRVQTSGGEIIDWLKGGRTDLKMGVCESFELYKNIDSAVSKWRVNNADGNYRSIGRIIGSDAAASQEFNCVEMDGSLLNVTTYARLYEDFVLRLDPSQIVNFAAWNTDKTKYSTAVGGQFHVPDRRALYQRNSKAGDVIGTYMQNLMLDHQHETSSGVLPVSLWGRGIVVRTKGNYGSAGNSVTDLTSPMRDGGGNDIVSGNEVRPESYVVRQFVLV